MNNMLSHIVAFFIAGLMRLQAGLHHLSTFAAPTIQSVTTATINETRINPNLSATLSFITSTFSPLNTIIVERLPAGSGISLRPIPQQVDDPFAIFNDDLLALLFLATILLLAIMMVTFFFFRLLATVCTCITNLLHNNMRARAERLEAAMALLRNELALKTKQSDEKLAKMQADHDLHQSQTEKAVASLQADLSTIKSHKAKLEATVEKLNSDNTDLWTEKFRLRAELAEQEGAWETSIKEAKADLAERDGTIKQAKADLAERDGDVRALIKMHRKTMALRETTIAGLRKQVEESAGAHSETMASMAESQLQELAALRKNSLEVMKRQTSNMTEKHQAEMAALREQLSKPSKK